MRHIFLSPHLDDVILSCGGLIWEQTRAGAKVEIWTVCSGDPPDTPLSPFADVLHAQWGTGRETPALRRKEDIAACRIVGASHRHFSFQDCIYRSGADGSWLYNPNTLMGEVNPVENGLIETLREFLSLLLRPDDVLLCPLAIGGHVDHRLTRLAAEGLGRISFYFADIPYLLNSPSVLAQFTGDMSSEVQPVTETGLRIWQDAIAAYASQTGMLFETESKMQEAIHGYWQTNSGIRLWRSE